MKTIEEAANAHALKTVCDLPTCVSEMWGEEWQGWFKDEFIAGVEFAQRWISVEEEMPKQQTPVLVKTVSEYGKYITIAEYIPKHTIFAADYLSDEAPNYIMDYDKSEEEYYIAEGWFECMSQVEENLFITDTITHWRQIEIK